MDPTDQLPQPRRRGARGPSYLRVLAGEYAAWLLLWLSLSAPRWLPAQDAQPEPEQAAAKEATVGMRGQWLGQFLPGSEVEAVPIEDRRRPVVVRIIETYPRAGGMAYDLEYYGLDPGTYDLKDYLRRQDGTSADDLPSLPVTIHPVRPPGQVLPNELLPQRLPFFGGYRLAMVLVSVAWMVGLVCIVTWMIRRRRLEAASLVEGPPVVSLAERLRPIIQDAVAGKLSQTRLAELERTLLAFWRHRLDLEGLKASEAIASLRQHPEAGELLRQLETWLHRPGTSGDVDVAALLRPYQDLPAESLPSP